jgi:hypothetical protein
VCDPTPALDLAGAEIEPVERLACNQNQPAPFLQYDVGSSRRQAAGDAVGDLAEAGHGAGRYKHADGPERPARNRSREIVDRKRRIREPPHVGDLPIGRMP